MSRVGLQVPGNVGIGCGFQDKCEQAQGLSVLRGTMGGGPVSACTGLCVMRGATGAR